MSYDGEDGSVDQSQWHELKWRRDQMEHNWPRNQYGSLLTQGEWDAVNALLSSVRDELQAGRLQGGLTPKGCHEIEELVDRGLVSKLRGDAQHE